MLETEVGRQLARSGVRNSRLVQERRTLARGGGRPYHVVEKVYHCPARFSPDDFVRDLKPVLQQSGFELLRTERRQGAGGWVTSLDLGFGRHRLYRLTLRAPGTPVVGPAVIGGAGVPTPPRRHGKVAIVLDDWGYSRRRVPDVLQLNRPVTLAVLPHRPYSRAVAEAVQGSLCEVILHLPMEPYDAASPREPKVLTTGMPQAAVRRLLEDALATVPYSRGVSNHQGSKATENAALMASLLTELHQRQLLFLDSLVTDRSVCPKVAREIQIPFAQRSVFLDNEATPQAVRQQILELAEVALRTGRAIGIGHDRRVTIEALREMMPQLERQGIEFVRLSELAQIQNP